jgi:ketosteroid isomerase-like protein
LSEQNKAVVREFFRSMEDGRMDDATKLLKDDARWWVVGSGEFDVQTMRGIWSQVFAAGPGVNRMTVIDMTAEGDRVVAEIEGRIGLPGGGEYKNTFLISFVIEGGKIAKAREYFDTALAQATFGQPG